MLVLYIYIKRLASKEILSPSNKIHREADRATDLSAPLYLHFQKPIYSDRLHTCQVSDNSKIFSTVKESNIFATKFQLVLLADSETINSGLVT